MGLAAPRKRRRIGADPNNTAWARDSSSYGQRILSSQGWTPGSVLGAVNAPQASHYTDATASHIRVVLKDDNLGLGARPGNSKADNFGLNVLQDIYGRLNGKSDAELQKEQAVRSDLNRRSYVEQKYGIMGFVRGGFLVGDRIEEVVPVENSNLQTKATITEASSDDEAIKDSAITPERREETKEEKKQRKLAKRQRKLEKQQRKDARALRRQEKAHKPAPEAKASSSSSTAEETTTTSTPHESLPASPMPSSDPESFQKVTALRGRMAVRKRYIQQKKMAGMNPQALREILMLKS